MPVEERQCESVSTFAEEYGDRVHKAGPVMMRSFPGAPTSMTRSLRLGLARNL